MKKKMLIAALIAFIVGAAVQEVKIISKLIKLRKSRKKTEELKKQLEDLKDKIELERCKQQIEWLKKNDPLKEDKIALERCKRQIEWLTKDYPLKAEIEKYKNLSEQISETKDTEELDRVLTEAVEDGVIKDPWDGDFDEFMSNPNNSLHF